MLEKYLWKIYINRSLVNTIFYVPLLFQFDVFCYLVLYILIPEEGSKMRYQLSPPPKIGLYLQYMDVTTFKIKNIKYNYN